MGAPPDLAISVYCFRPSRQYPRCRGSSMTSICSQPDVTALCTPRPATLAAGGRSSGLRSSGPAAHRRLATATPRTDPSRPVPGGLRSSRAQVNRSRRSGWPGPGVDRLSALSPQWAQATHCIELSNEGTTPFPRTGSACELRYLRRTRRRTAVSGSAQVTLDQEQAVVKLRK